MFIGADPATTLTTKLVSSRLQGSQVIMTCALASDRTASERLQGQWIWVDRQKAVGSRSNKPAVKSEQATKSEGLLWADLIGVLVEGNDGVAVGKVLHVYNAGASDVLAISNEAGARFDVPLVGDYVNEDDLQRPPESGVLRLKVPASWFTDL